jgi:protein-disulfide isomerase
VTVYEFADLQCPYCADASRDVLPSVVREYVRTGRIRLDFRPLEFLGPDSDRGARAVLAAGRQNLGWNLLEALYAQQGAENSGWLSEGALREIAGGIPGLDVDRMIADMPGVTPSLEQAAGHANELGVRGTPSFFVKRPLVEAQDLGLSSLTPTGFRTAIEPLIA